MALGEDAGQRFLEEGEQAAFDDDQTRAPRARRETARLRHPARCAARPLLLGAKEDEQGLLYPSILALVEPRLHSGSLIVADNADHNPEFLAHIRNPANGYLSLPFGEDVELFMRS